MNNFFVFVLLLLVALTVFYAAHNNVIFKKPPASFLDESLQVMRIGEHKFFVVVADTQRARAQGLSGVPSIEDNQGMLFIFDVPGYHAFVMRDMLFGLDFVWIRDGKVVGITEKIFAPLREDDERVLYHPPQEIDMVLETRAGISERLHIKAGDSVQLL